MNLAFLLIPIFLIAQNIETPHKVLKFECSTCHNSTTWREVKFDHSKTSFTLESRHKHVKCMSCHSLEDFKLSSNDCISCHEDIHQGKLSPSCERCHTPSGWMVFNSQKVHAGTSFPLIGVHASLDCKACHTSEIEGEYSSLKSECFSCHNTDFQQASAPSHTQMGFGTNCEECHFLASWHPADFLQHDLFFPIFSGRHQGVWNSCAICHSNPQNYRVFSCFNCHEHSQSRMDGTHSDVRAYSYDSNACFTCHPSGNRGD